MKDENDFLCEINMMISDALWSECELGKKEKILAEASKKITQRIIDTLPPGTVLMA